MKDQQRIVQLWPDAPADVGVFTHLELKFDLLDNKVTTETAAKDIHGEPYYKHILDTQSDSSISFTGTDVTSYRPPGTPTSPPTSVPQVPAAPVPTATVPTVPAASPTVPQTPWETQPIADPWAQYQEDVAWKNYEEAKKAAVEPEPWMKWAAEREAIANG